jgi:hypothetical protein
LLQTLNGITREQMPGDDSNLEDIDKAYRCKQIDWAELAKAGQEAMEEGLAALMPECTGAVTDEMLKELVADMVDHPSCFFIMLRRPDFGRKAGYGDALVFPERFITLAYPGPMHWMKGLGKRILRSIFRRCWDNTIGPHGQVERPAVLAFFKVCRNAHELVCCLLDCLLWEPWQNKVNVSSHSEFVVHAMLRVLCWSTRKTASQLRPEHACNQLVC